MPSPAPRCATSRQRCRRHPQHIAPGRRVLPLEACLDRTVPAEPSLKIRKAESIGRHTMPHRRLRLVDTGEAGGDHLQDDFVVFSGAQRALELAKIRIPTAHAIEDPSTDGHIGADRHDRVCGALRQDLPTCSPVGNREHAVEVRRQPPRRRRFPQRQDTPRRKIDACLRERASISCEPSGRRQHIVIGEHQQLAACVRHRRVQRTGLTRLGFMQVDNRCKGGSSRRCRDHSRCLVDRAVIDDHDFEGAARPLAAAIPHRACLRAAVRDFASQ